MDLTWKPQTGVSSSALTPGLVCLLARDIGGTGQAISLFIEAPKSDLEPEDLNSRPIFIPTRPSWQRASPFLLGEMSRASKQPSIGLHGGKEQPREDFAPGRYDAVSCAFLFLQHTLLHPKRKKYMMAHTCKLQSAKLPDGQLSSMDPIFTLSTMC